MAKDKTEYKWKDRVRHMGIPISCTKYYMDDERLYVDSGFFTTKTDELLLYRILDVKTTRTLWQKIFGMGTVTLYAADQSNRTLELKNIKKSKAVHKMISDVVEEQRQKRGIVGREMVGTNSIGAHCDCDEEDNDTAE